MKHNNNLLNKLIVDTEAIVSNFLVLKSSLPSHVECASDIRVNAYGVGALEVMRSLSSVNCNKFFVSNIEEAINLRNSVSITDNIFVLDGIFSGEEMLFAQNYIFPVINNKEQFELYNNFSTKKNKSFEVALNITNDKEGFGILIDEAIELWERGFFNKKLKVKYLVSDFDLSNPKKIAKMIELKQKTNLSIAVMVPSDFKVQKDAFFDLAIFGVSIFGCSFSNVNLLPSLFLLSRIIELEVQKTEKEFLSERKRVLAKVPIGYAHGICANIAVNGRYSIGGFRADILDNIKMESTTIDVTKIPSYELEVGAEVEIIGNNISLEDMAKWANISVEHLLTSISHRIKRIYL